MTLFQFHILIFCLMVFAFMSGDHGDSVDPAP